MGKIVSPAYMKREKEHQKLVWLINESENQTFKGRVDGKIFIIKPGDKKVVSLGEARFMVGDQEETDKKKVDDMIHDLRNQYGKDYNSDVHYEFDPELNSEDESDENFVPPSLDLEE